MRNDRRLAALGALLALVCALAGAWWFTRAPARGRVALTPTTLPGSATEAAPAALAGVEPPVRRASTETKVEAHAPAPVPAHDDGPIATLAVFATDVDGVPAPGVRVLAAPPLHALNLIGTTDQRGRLEFAWRSSLWPAELVVEAQRRSGHSLTGLRRLLVDADGRSELELVLAPAYLPDPDGYMELRPPQADAGAPGRRVASSASLVGDWDVGDLRDLSDDAERKESARTGPLLHDVTWDQGGRAEFVAGEPMTDGSEVYEVLSEEWTSEAASDVPPTLARVEGRVDDERGEPVAGVRVAVERPDGWAYAHVRTGHDGRYRVEVDAVEVVLRAGLGELVLPRHPARGARLAVTLQRGGVFDFSPRISRGPRLECRMHQQRVLDANTTRMHYLPGSGYRLEYSTLEPLASGERLRVAVGDCSDAFAVTGLGAPAGETHCVPSRSEAEVEHQTNVATSAEWVQTWAGLVDFTVQPLDSADAPAGEVRLWQPDRRRGVRIGARGALDAPLQLRATAGTWVISIGAATAHWSAEHAFTLETGAKVALGAIELGPSATVRFAPLRERAEASRLRLMREHFGAASIVIAPSLPSTLQAITRSVPAGAYQIEFAGRTPEALRLEPGQTWTPTWP